MFRYETLKFKDIDFNMGTSALISLGLKTNE